MAFRGLRSKITIDRTFALDADAPADDIMGSTTSQAGSESVTLAASPTEGDDTLNGTEGPDTLDGLGGNDTINGFGGNDILIGGTGADTMDGGGGDDTFYVDNESDVVIENSHQGGTDTIYSSVSYTLVGRYVETLILTGSAAINATGNNLRNTLIGNSGANLLLGDAEGDVLVGNGGNDTLVGGSGDDSMEGGAGDDIYYVDNISDNVIENSPQGGADTIYSSVSYSLVGRYVETLTLTGSSDVNATGNNLANTLNGNSGANALDGGAGADVLNGLAGDDLYYVDNTSDVVIENSPQGGFDVIYSSVSYTLANRYIEWLSLTGSAAINATGNNLDNFLFGNSGANVLTGLLGNDRLDGGEGADTLDGGGGDDTYSVDNVGDVVIENSPQGGYDTIYSTVSYTLANRYVENLTLSGSDPINATGNNLDNILIGNSGANVLTGLAGGDYLNAGAGADTMDGGAGNDTYVVDDAGDVVIENSHQGGFDLIYSFVSYSLVARYVETLQLAGTAPIDGTGNNLANTLIGNSSNNVLTGGAGADRFVFDTPLDGAANVDTITDFSVADDTIQLDRDIFTAFTITGEMASSAFHAGTVAADADDRIIYDSATGAIYYDADGSGPGAQVLFAYVDPNTALTHADFLIGG